MRALTYLSENINPRIYFMLPMFINLSCETKRYDISFQQRQQNISDWINSYSLILNQTVE